MCAILCNEIIVDALCNPHGENIDSVTDCITEFRNFCVQGIVPSKHIRCFSNNSWVTPYLKALLKKKKRALTLGDSEELKRVQSELRQKNDRLKLQQHLEQHLGGIKESDADVRPHLPRLAKPPQIFTPQLRAPHPSPLFTVSRSWCPAYMDHHHHHLHLPVLPPVSHSAPGEDRTKEAKVQEAQQTVHIQPEPSLREGSNPVEPSCVIPVPKLFHPRELSHYGPDLFTNYIEKIVLGFLRTQMNSHGSLRINLASAWTTWSSTCCTGSCVTWRPVEAP